MSLADDSHRIGRVFKIFQYIWVADATKTTVQAQAETAGLSEAGCQADRVIRSSRMSLGRGTLRGMRMPSAALPAQSWALRGQTFRQRRPCDMLLCCPKMMHCRQ